MAAHAFNLRRYARTTLTTYSYAAQGGESVATMSGVISISSQLVDRVVFTKSSIFISGTEQLIRCDAGISGESWRLLTYGYKLCDYSPALTRPLFLFVPRGEGAMNEVKLYSVDEAAQSSSRSAHGAAERRRAYRNGVQRQNGGVLEYRYVYLYRRGQTEQNIRA